MRISSVWALDWCVHGNDHPVTTSSPMAQITSCSERLTGAPWMSKQKEVKPLSWWGCRTQWCSLASKPPAMCWESSLVYILIAASAWMDHLRSCWQVTWGMPGNCHLRKGGHSTNKVQMPTPFSRGQCIHNTDRELISTVRVLLEKSWSKFTERP